MAKMIEINSIKDIIKLSDNDLLDYIDEDSLKDTSVQVNNIKICYIRVYVTQDVSIKLIVGNPNGFVFSNPIETHLSLSSYNTLTIKLVTHSNTKFDMSIFDRYSWASLFSNNEARNISKVDVCKIIRNILRQDNIAPFK